MSKITKKEPFYNFLKKGELLVVPYIPLCGNQESAFWLAKDFIKAEPGKAVAFFSLNKTVEQIACIFIAITSGVSISKLITGKVTSEEFARISEYMSAINALPLYVDDMHVRNLTRLQNKVKQLAVKVDLGLVIVDCLQSIGASTTKEAQEGLSELAKELDISVAVFPSHKIANDI